MKIDAVTGNQKVVNKIEANLETKKTEKNNDFEKMVHSSVEKEAIEEVNGRAGLKEAIDSLNQLKKELDLEVTVENLDKYKKEVKQFMEYFVANELERKDIVIQDRRGFEKKLTIVKLVDEKMDNLTKQLLKENYDHLEVLQQIGKIHGLVINLLA